MIGERQLCEELPFSTLRYKAGKGFIEVSQGICFVKQNKDTG